MISLSLTLLLILCLVVFVFWKATPNPDGNGFFNKDYTTTLKGICSIIVIFVHVPENYGNVLQDALGSFAFVGVTGFFMISAYGMQYSLSKNRKYLSTFPINRLSALLIPNIVVNIIFFVALYVIASITKWEWIYTLNHYVTILLEYCLLFYIVNLLAIKLSWKPGVCEIILIAAVAVSSLLLYLFNYRTTTNSAQMGWCYERFGLVWGILLYQYYGKIKTWLGTGYITKFVLGLIIAVALGLLYLKFKTVPFWGEYLLKIVLGLSVILFYFLATYKLRLSNGFTRILGGISYETYLAHGFVATLLILVFPQIGSGLFIWLQILITLGLSYFVNKLDKQLVARAKALFSGK